MEGDKIGSQSLGPHTQPDIPHHSVLRLFDEYRCHAINAMLVASDQIFDEVQMFSHRSSNLFSDILRSFNHTTKIYFMILVSPQSRSVSRLSSHYVYQFKIPTSTFKATHEPRIQNL